MANRNWAIIEGSGMDKSFVRQDGFESYRDAVKRLKELYDEDEEDDLHVDIAFWDETEQMWSYDY